jgi:hypothetical protein
LTGHHAQIRRGRVQIEVSVLVGSISNLEEVNSAVDADEADVVEDNRFDVDVGSVGTALVV